MRMRSFVLAFVVACGGGGSQQGQPDGTPIGGDGPGGMCGTLSCDDVCGPATDACGNAITCPRCQFSSEPITTGSSGNMIFIPGAMPEVALGGTIYTKGSTWTSETVTGATTITGFAIAPDGTRYVAYKGTSTPEVAREDNGTWTTTAIGGAAYSDISLAIASDGTVFAAWNGEDERGEFGLDLATRAPNGTWSYAKVADTMSSTKFVGVAAIGGVPWIAWAANDDGALHVAHLESGAFVNDIVDTNVPPNVDHHLSIIADAAGNPHVAYRQDSPLFREIDHAVRIGGTWHLDKAAVMKHGNQGQVSLAASPSGDLAVTYRDDFGNWLALLHAGAWSHQPLTVGDAVVGYDPVGTLDAIVSDQGIELWVRSGRYPADYDATCASVAAAVCPAACSCRGGGNCCYQNMAATTGFSGGPESYCEESAQWQLCADASRDPQGIVACQGALGASTCTNTCQQLPAACALSQ